MSSEELPVETILEAIDGMDSPKRPKVILFDIGGVCVSQGTGASAARKKRTQD